MDANGTANPGLHDEFVRQLNDAHRRLLAYLVSLLGNRQDAEDVLQLASMTMWRRFVTFERGTNFLAWASTVAFYEAKNFQRIAARSRLHFSDELLNTLAAERVPDLSRTDDRIEALGQCVQKLDESGRRLLEAIYLDDGSINALAEQMGRAPQTLYNKLNLIRRALAECVERKLGSEGGAR